VTSPTDSERIDDASFAEMYRRHYAHVLAYALRRTARPSADDVVAETFLIAWRRRDDLVGDPLPWLLGVARRVLANQRRASRRFEAVAQRSGRQGQQAEQPRDEDAHFQDSPIALAIASLGEHDRESLLLTAWEGLAPAEAARVVGCSAATFRVRLHRARRRLGQALAEAESHESCRAAPTRVLPSESKG
jgi:RNA polymerase sigma factor (sigma-70 family)